MRLKKTICATLCLTISYALQAEKSRLQLTATVAKSCAASKPHLASVVLRNSGTKSIRLRMLSCGYFKQLSTDSKHIRVASWPCHGDVPTETEISPESEETLMVPLYFEDASPGQIVEFSLKFQAIGEPRSFSSPKLFTTFSKVCPTDPWTAGLALDSSP